MLRGTAHSDFQLWIINPQSWYGMHKVVKHLVDAPLALWLVFVAYILGKFSGEV